MLYRMPHSIEINNMTHFSEILLQNPGLVIIKFGAEWCAPCKKIASQVHDWLQKMPNNVHTIVVDIDESFEVYAYLKTKKMVNGIPAILCYDQGNINYIPSDSVIGANVGEVDAFFDRCLRKLSG